MPGKEWYRYGTVTITKNSDHVTGTDTLWAAGVGIKPGDMFSIDSLHEYEIKQVIDDLNLLLKTPYLGDSVVNAQYRIVRITPDSTADIAADLAELTETYRRYFDSDLETLTGKSAYQLAVDNGFVGTESEWLESLTAYGVAKKGGYSGTQAEWLESLSAYGVAKKGGYTGTQAEWLESLKAENGEWQEASQRLTTAEGKITTAEQKLNVLSFVPSGVPAWLTHNMFYRGAKNLGTEITDAQYNQIRNGTFEDMYPGDYWKITIGGEEKRLCIVQVNTNSLDMMYSKIPTSIADKMNDTNTTEGGYIASKMHTEILPAVLADLEEAIGAEHIAEKTYYLTNSNVKLSAPSRWGWYPTTQVTSKMELFSVYDMYYGDESGNFGSVMRQPYALFKILGSMPWTTPYQTQYNALEITTWLRDIAADKPTTNFAFINIDMGEGELSSAATGPGWATAHPHFVLIP